MHGFSHLPPPPGGRFALILQICPSSHHTSQPHTYHIPASLKVPSLAFFFVIKLHLFNFSRPSSSLFPPGAGSLTHTLKRYHDRQQFHVCFLSALCVITHSHQRWYFYFFHFLNGSTVDLQCYVSFRL